MVKRFLRQFIAMAVLASISVCSQADDGLGIGVGVRASTLGMGIELGKSLTDKFSLRLGLNDYSESDSQTIDNIDYGAELDMNSTTLMLDWHPFGGAFHLTAGYLSSSNKISALATPTGAVDIGGQTVIPVSPGDLVLNSGVELGSGPYVGLGWGNVPSSGFGFVFELGVVQMGTPDVSLTVSGDPAITSLIDQAEINQEIANMEADLDEFDIYPVIALGISYGF